MKAVPELEIRLRKIQETTEKIEAAVRQTETTSVTNGCQLNYDHCFTFHFCHANIVKHTLSCNSMQLSLQLFKRFSKSAWFLGKKGSGLQANKLLSKKDIPNKYGHKPGLVDILCKKLSLMFWCLFFFNQLWTSWTLQTSNHQSKQHKLSQNDWTQTLPIKSSPRSAVGPGRKNIYKWM